MSFNTAELSKIEQILEGKTTGLYLVHGTTGTGKKWLMNRLAQQVAASHNVLMQSVANTSFAPDVQPQDLINKMLRSSNPLVLAFGVIRDEVHAERAIHMARHALVIATMHGVELKPMVDQLAWLASSKEGVQKVLIGQSSLAYEDTDYAPENAAWRTPWFTTPKGRKVTIQTLEAESADV